MKKVAVIILNYNGFKYLPALLGSIFSYLPRNVEQELIVVDNNSTDNSVEYLKNEFSQIKLILNEENLGFAEGNNMGIKYAMQNNFDYVMLLNQDIRVTQGYLDKLVEVIEKDEKISAVQPKILLYPETDQVNSLGNVIHYLGFGYTYGHKEKDTKSLFENKEINYCSGAAVLYKVSALRKVGLFYPELFMYHEDLDLGWRMKLMGFKNVIEVNSTIYHQYEFSRSIKKYYYMERNRYIVIFQSYKVGTIILILPLLFITELGLLLFSLFNGFFKEKLKVYLYFLRLNSWVKIKKKRNKIQGSRILSDRQVVKDFSGEIKHQEVRNNILTYINPLFDLYWQVIKRLIIW